MSATDSAIQPSALLARDPAEKNRAWRELYRISFSPMYRFLCRNGVTPAEAEELTQKVYATALKRLSEGAHSDNLMGWLYGIALRVVRQHYRWHRVRRLKAFMLPDTLGAAPSATGTPLAELESASMQHHVQAVLSSMSTKLREVLVLVDIEDLRPQEAAVVLRIPVNTVRSRRRLAHEDFKRRWRDLAGDRELVYGA